MIKFNTRNKIAFISSYPPRMCGIATFTSHLVENMLLASEGSFEPVIIAMQSDASEEHSQMADFIIRKDAKSDYMEAADFINSSNIDMVVLQHEFGLFGGDGGSYIGSLLQRINTPVFTTLHTVLGRPASEYFQSLIDVCANSEKVIVMNKRGVDMLEKIYGVSKRKIRLIPHGILDVPFGRTEIYKGKLNLGRRKVIMTFGLLGPNKGIEIALDAMPDIIKKNPDVLYLIVGRTHPEIVKRYGYSYRKKLQDIVETLGIQNNVLFHDRFVTDQQLKEFLAATDIYVTPYLHKEQLTSGTLAFAAGCGKAVVSTPYWAAEELLDQGRGMLVPFGDSQKLSETIVELLNNAFLLKGMQFNAYNYGRSMIWSNVGRQYWQFVSKSLYQMPTKQYLEFSKNYASLDIYSTRALQNKKRLSQAIK